MYDVIVIGARCAGAPTALLLARKGYRVLLVDRATFPSDTISTHFMRVWGGRQLREWGLLDKLTTLKAPPIHTWITDLGDGPLVGTPPQPDGVAPGYTPRRALLDNFLIDAAVAAGVELRTGFSVSELLMDDGRVTGICGRSRGGVLVSERASIVVGADGKNSLVARTVRAPAYDVVPPLVCYYYSYWRDVPSSGLEMYRRPHRVVIAFPTNDDLTLILVGWSHQEFASFRSNVPRNMLDTIDQMPFLAERVQRRQPVERFYGTADLPNFFRKPYGPGWALVGDAGYHRDPLGAYGISDAFRDADLLAAAIDQGFSGQQPVAAALAHYEQRRNALAKPFYERNCQGARLGAAHGPQLLQLRAAIRGNQSAIDLYMGQVAGTITHDEFIASAQIQRIMDMTPS